MQNRRGRVIDERDVPKRRETTRITGRCILGLSMVLIGAEIGHAGGAPSSAPAGYAAVLKTRVRNGLVDYKGLKDADLEKLDAFLEYIAKAKVPGKRSEKIAFYINAYNALVLRAVVTEGRPRSVLDVKGFFKTEKHQVAGRTVSLDALEKKILNPFAKDPRLHFVLVCAAVGCPILESTPYHARDLESRLDAATRRYLGSNRGATTDGKSVKVSKLFDWYKTDFGGEEGVKQFLTRYLPAKVKAVYQKAPALGYIDYNWSLNQQ